MSNSFLNTPIEYLKSVGPQKAELLKKELRIFKYYDLLTYYPFRYVDRTKFYKVKEINADLPFVQLRGKIMHTEMVGVKRAQRFVATFLDDTGKIELVWFQGAKWISEKIKPHLTNEYIVFGRPAEFNGRFNISHPEIDLVSDENTIRASALQAVYNSTDKLKIRGLDTRGIARAQKTLVSLIKNNIPETLSNTIRERYHLITKEEAVKQIHAPQNPEMLKKAEFRLKFEELFFIQLKLLKQKGLREKMVRGFVFAKVGGYFNNFYNNYLPFQLTNAQKRVIKEIRLDMGSGKQMNRLLQGDVGSGKTMVALMNMLIAMDNGFQACLMAPTEILANQHFESLSQLLKPLNINVGLLTGSKKVKERRIIHEQLLNGDMQILIGTHALLEDVVQFKNIGLVVIDEQHRFGVAQRAKMWNKGPSPALPEGKGADSAPNYATARASSYQLLKELQVETKKRTTETEAILWNYLKGKNLEEYKFRRQHIIDEFIVDFVCLTKKLIIEIDGKYHERPEMIEADKLRTQILQGVGFKIIRFTNEEVIGHIESVLKKIVNELGSLPFGEGRGGATSPHVLIMSATPIPRTLAMTLYGDLDVSVIDELPPGRKPIQTIHRFDNHRDRIFGFMKEQISLGRQIYVVYPLIKESEKMDYKDLMDGYESIVRAFPLPQYNVSIVHGQMKANAKEYEMQRFVRGETQIMVATTVIEVGVNVPNASVMVIESAERFGLSQLHQLRGRVGRGADQSYCILMTSHKLSHDGKLRMETMCRTNDGFEIADVDLKLRGPGDMAGTVQSGVLDLNIADLAKDAQILHSARNMAIELLSEDPNLEKPENSNIAYQFALMNSNRTNWSRIS
jgi:ATP-dependent DNA helicase RecG